MTLAVVVIGAGSTGAALAHDLALRGYRVTVVERGEVASETTGRNHGLFHSGARYVLTDQAAARECAEDNVLLRRLMPDILELNGGLFIALDEEDESHREAFLDACAEAGVPATEITPEQALSLEPHLNPGLRAAVLVPDGVFDAFHFSLAFLATSRSNGAAVHTFTEVVDVVWAGRAIAGVRVRDRRGGDVRTIGADLVVNAAGPWADRIGDMAGVRIPLSRMAGTMVAVDRRWTRRVINRLGPPGDGGILVPQRRTSVIGTTSWPVKSPDFVAIPPAQIRALLDAGQALVPHFNQAATRGISAAVRPLLSEASAIEAAEPGGRGLTRGFNCFDHASDGAPGFFSIVGGKTTTARYMAEVMGDLIGQSAGIAAECPTKEARLQPYHTYYPD